MTAREPESPEEPLTEGDGDQKHIIEQKYDAAMRHWAEQHVSTVAGWLDPTVADLAPSAFQKQAATFAVPAITADLLTTAGKNRLMHIEYETSPRRGLIARMFNYRARIMMLYPRTRLTQHVIVLGNGRVRGHDDESNGFILHLHVVYLREREAADYLKDPVLAPFAVLTRGRRAARERSFGAALRLIRDSGLPDTGQLLQTAETLAAIRLDPITISRIRKENGMSIQPLVDHYRDTEVGQHLTREGIEKGIEKGIQKGRNGVLQALLEHRFGKSADVAEVVRRLNQWSEVDAINAIESAPGLQTLLTAEAPA